MNRLKYANDLVRNAASLLTSLSADVEDVHYGALMGTIQQLELLQEAIDLKATALTASEALQIDVVSMLGESGLSEDAATLLDDYVSVRLSSIEAAVLSIQSRYLESDDKPLAMIGRSIFEARRWIGAATYAVNAELEEKLFVRLVA
ncbi:hypothetical protein HaloA020_29420 [Halomonas sp. A020]|uniref:hypothetical protein n=1 Tax=Halomonas sp. A020 TaxID=2717374 RepID=UPI002491537A|nr:hypothetical protein [Halomonas sp. A020]BCB62241.1 hypothetical protein HaloA020_29420 [Halomonas sp. A020]